MYAFSQVLPSVDGHELNLFVTYPEVSPKPESVRMFTFDLQDGVLQVQTLFVCVCVYVCVYTWKVY